MFIESSEKTCVGSTTDAIHMWTQFYIDKDSIRNEELRFALRKNVENPHISSMTLLNERLYSKEELGIDHPKLTQLILGKRLQFKDVLERHKFGYNILANADIFVDETIQGLQQSDIHCEKKMYSLLRYEYGGGLFGSNSQVDARSDSVDTWILHSNHKLTSKELSLFKIDLGTPGCDVKLNYLYTLLGFKIYNDPLYIKTYHCHVSKERNYSKPIRMPWMAISPYGVKSNCPTVGNHPVFELDTYNFSNANERLISFISTKRFLIPRIAGIENITAVLRHMNQSLPPNLVQKMKVNAGIHLSNEASSKEYSKHYLSAFASCDAYASWEPWGAVYSYIEQSHRYIQATFPKPQVWACGFDIFHYIKKPWTHALSNRRILIVSPFVETIKNQPLAYDVDLFPGCTFVYVKPPQTHGTNKSRDWFLEFVDLCNEVSTMEFDVALCSCGGYGNPLCSYIYNSLGKSAIYVGGVLQMYFGLYGNRWLQERKECVSLYMNPTWKRPLEKPVGSHTIESNCYW